MSKQDFEKLKHLKRRIEELQQEQLRTDPHSLKGAVTRAALVMLKSFMDDLSRDLHLEIRGTYYDKC